MLNLTIRFRRWRLKKLQAAIDQAWSTAEDTRDFQICNLYSERAQKLEKKRDELRWKLGETPYPVPEIPFQPNR